MVELAAAIRRAERLVERRHGKLEEQVGPLLERPAIRLEPRQRFDKVAIYEDAQRRFARLERRRLVEHHLLDAHRRLQRPQILAVGAGRQRDTDERLSDAKRRALALRERWRRTLPYDQSIETRPKFNANSASSVVFSIMSSVD